MTLSEITEFVSKTKLEKGKKAFPWDESAIKQYLSWAFSRDSLFISVENSKVSGVLIVYPIRNPNGTPAVSDMLPSDDNTGIDENTSDLCIMDGIFSTPTSRRTITSEFKKRFKNWKNQNKWTIRGNSIKSLDNRYIEITSRL